MSMRRISSIAKTLTPVIRRKITREPIPAIANRPFSSILDPPDTPRRRPPKAPTDSEAGEPFDNFGGAVGWSAKEQSRIDRGLPADSVNLAETSELLETGANPADPKDPNDQPTTSPSTPSKDVLDEWRFLLDGVDPADQQAASSTEKSDDGSESTRHTGARSGELKEDEQEMFQRLLDSLLEKPMSPKKPPSDKPSKSGQGSRGISAIERQLMDLMQKKTPIYRKQASIPMFIRFGGSRFGQGGQHPGYSRTTTKLWQLPSVDSAHVMVQERDQAYSIINRLLQCQTNTEFRDFVFEHVFANPLRGPALKGKQDQPALPAFYSALVSAAISHALTFRDPYLALAIFEQTKLRSLDSYVAGCTTEVYNHILRTRWDYWKDVQGMELLVDEMMMNGVGFDDRTRQIVGLVMTEIVGGEFGEQGELIGGSGGQWGDDDRRAVNRMVDLVGKWLVKYTI